MSDISYQDAPRPLTDKERSLLKRIFSDFFEVPGEWKTALRSDLERDPPILGASALGGQTVTPKPGSVINDSVAAGAGIMLEKLASSGQIGNSSGVEILANAIRLGGDVTISRSAAGVFRVSGVAEVMRASSGLQAFGVFVNGDSNYRLMADSSGVLTFGPGSGTGDTNLYRNAANRLKTDDLFDATPLALATKQKAGTPVDGDWTANPPDGTLVVDSTASKLWARVGGTWKGVVLT